MGIQGSAWVRDLAELEHAAAPYSFMAHARRKLQPVSDNRCWSFWETVRMHEPIAISELDAMFAEIMGSALLHDGFEQVNRRRWVRSTKQPIRELFCLVAMKGACYSPRWGFSLDFVPHVSGSSVRWHRSANAVLLDLCYDPLDLHDQHPGVVCTEP
jgi:hypothetical protein